jgi:hypothetical protein
MMSAIVPPQPILKDCLMRPKARFFGFVSLVGGGALLIPFIVFLNPLSVISDLDLAELESWRTVAWCAVSAEAVFLLLTLFFWLFEKPRRVVQKVYYGAGGGPIIH